MKNLQCLYKKFVEVRQNLLTVMMAVRYDKFQMGKIYPIRKGSKTTNFFVGWMIKKEGQKSHRLFCY